jgi:glycosyltransferase 2 family protein
LAACSISGEGSLRAKVIAVFVLTLLCLGFVLWGLDLPQVVSHLSSVNLVWLLPPLLLYTLNSAARTYRYLLLIGGGVSFIPSFSAVSVAFLATNVIPLRMGELVKPYLFMEKHEVPFGVGMAGLVMERALDILALLFFVIWLGVMVDLPAEGLMVGGVDLLYMGQRSLGTLALLIGLTGLVMAWFGEALVGRLVRLLAVVSEPWSQRFEDLGMGFSRGFQQLVERPKVILFSAGWTVVIWLFTLLSLLFVLRGFGVAPLSFDLLVTNFTGTILGITVLPTPGYVGGFEAGCVASLLLFEVPKDLAGAYAVLLHAVMFFHTVTLGVGCLMWEGWSLRNLVSQSRLKAG